MITTSAYSEPVFAKALFNEQPQLQTFGIYEAEEYESGSFERILAEFKQKDEIEGRNEYKTRSEDDNYEIAVKCESENVKPEQSAENKTETESGLEYLADLKTKTDSIIFHDTAKVPVNTENSALSTAEVSVTENLTKEEIPEEHFFALQAAENQLNQSSEKVKSFANEDGELKTVSADLKTDGIQESKAALANNVLKDTDKKSASVSQAVSGEIPQENLQADTAVKNDTGKEQVIAAVNKEKGEKPLSGDTRSEKHAVNASERSVNAEQPKREVNQNTRLDDTRARARRDRINIEVHNQRTAAAAEQVSYSQTHSDAPVKEITLELRLPYQQGQSSSQSSAQTVWEAGSSSALENMLARELHQNFNGDIVRHASMVLRDGGEGTIKLALKPENLGNVKIHLEMSENKITGSIVVESEEALNAFKREIASLEQAFRESGFSDANLNLSLGMEGGNTAGNKDETSFMQNMIALHYDDSSLMQGIETEMQELNVFIGNKPSTINLLA